MKKKLTFDEKTFLANYQGMEDLAQQTVQSFLEILPEMITAIHKAIQNKNSKELEIAAHTLKGAVSNFYAEPTRLLAEKLEQFGFENKMSEYDSVFNELMNELKKLEATLRDFKITT